MGALLSAFKWKKSKAELLEQLHDKIKELEAHSADSEIKRKNLIKFFFTVFTGLSVALLTIVYFNILPHWYNKIIITALLLLWPAMYCILRPTVSWYFNRRKWSSQTRLKELKKRKKELLDEIMDRETYKVAKDILEKYAPETIATHQPQSASRQIVARPQGKAASMGLFSRQQQQQQNQMHSSQHPHPHQHQHQQPMRQPPPPPPPGGASAIMGQTTSNMPLASALSDATLDKLLPGGPMKFPGDKGYMERLFEYLIGEGLNNKYALICRRCTTHNGMALREEFEYIAFTCYRCKYTNPARKQRPIAPKIETEETRQEDQLSDTESNSSESGGSDHSGLRIEEVKLDVKGCGEDEGGEDDEDDDSGGGGSGGGGGEDRDDEGESAEGVGRRDVAEKESSESRREDTDDEESTSTFGNKSSGIFSNGSNSSELKGDADDRAWRGGSSSTEAIEPNLKTKKFHSDSVVMGSSAH